jgi:hypothetical protein
VKNSAEHGFILVATLWFVALLAFAAVVIEGWISASLDRGAALAERVTARGALLSAEERVAFIMAGGGVSARGLELTQRDGASDPGGGKTAAPVGPFIALDDRPYRVGDVVVRLQDGAGLYDLSSASRDTLGKLFKSYSIAGPEAEALTSALLDYVGKPADIRASSIRDADYSRAGLPLPRHAPLLTPWEPLRILGWNGVNAMWRGSASFPEIATLGPIGGLNVNTAPAQVLAALSGMDEREAERLVLSRAVAPITDLRDLNAVAGSFSGEDRPLAFMPSNIIRLKMIEPGDPLMQIIEIRLTPLARTPYRIDYAVDLPPDAATSAINNAALLPELPTAAPALR